MPFADDEPPVRALSADGPYAPFRISVHPGSLGSSEQHVYTGRGEHGVEGAGEFAVPVPDQARETSPVSSRSAVRSRASCVSHAPSGYRVTPSRWTRRVRCSITNAAYSRVRENAQSRWNRSIAKMDRAWARRNVRHWSSRADGGGIRRRRRILRIVPAPIRCPRRRSSSWMRTTPRPGSLWRAGRSTRRVPSRAVAVPVTGAGSTSWSPCGGASAATFQGSRPGASASPSAASGTTPRAWPDRSTRAAAWGSPGAARRPPGAGPESRCPSRPTTEPAAPARTAPRHRTGRSDEPARWPIIAGPSWWPSCRRTTGGRMLGSACGGVTGVADADIVLCGAGRTGCPGSG